MVMGSIVTEPDGDRLVFIYDHTGCIDPDSTYADRDPNSPLYDPNPTEPILRKVWTLNELVGPIWLEEYPELNSSYGMAQDGFSSSGLVVGVVWDSTVDTSGLGQDTRMPVYLDLTDPILELKLVPTPLPISEYDSISAPTVSDAGDIHFRLNHAGTVQSYLYRPARDGEPEESILLPDLGVSFEGINALRQLIAEDRDNEVIVRYTIIDSTGNGIVDEIPTIQYSANGRPGSRDWTIIWTKGPNNLGQFTAELHINKGSDAGRYIVRYGGAPGNLTEERRFLLPTATSTFNGPPNDSGDTAYSEGLYPDTYYFHEGAPADGDEVLIPRIENLIVPESKPAGLTTSNGFHDSVISNRDATGYGWLVGYFANDGTVQGRRPYLLEPIVATAEPGIIVNPAANLITSESGGTDAFDVVLNTEPSADVTIGFSSDNTSEGTIDNSSLTFTPANWSTPQTVTITGVDDLIEDGDVAYTIITAAAMSTDPDYNGLDADDISVTNLDDDGPSGGGSATYSVLDDLNWQPLPIPDNNPVGISSTINISDNHQITGLTVALDISHQRSSDLQVVLASSNGVQVPLSNFSGGNSVSDFNGSTSTGDWTLEVIDTRNRKEGTLNSWSITVDY
jgi:hypothetical protein